MQSHEHEHEHMDMDMDMAGMDHTGHGGSMGTMAGMDHTGHGGHAAHVAKFRRLFWINLVLAIPTVAFSGGFAMLVGYTVPDGPWRWVSPVVGTVMYLWGGSPFLTGARDEFRARKPAMMMLVALAITVACASSWAATLGLVADSLEYWWELALLVVIMLLGHWIEMRSLAQTSSALDSLAALLPDQAEKVVGDNTVVVAPADLRVGDLIVVRPGSSLPVDGTVVDGRAEVDESMVTGESTTVSRGVGDKVVAGTIATDSGLRVEVTAVGDQTTLAGIRRMVANAQNSTSRTQRLADRAAGWLFWFALGAAAITAVVWSLADGAGSAVEHTIAVLVIACPHALGLAIPLVVAIATERGAKAGLLVQDRLSLEAMRTVTTVLFDKTGTLTKGAPALVHLAAAETADQAADETDRVLMLAAAAESDSEHPLARAIVAAATQRQLSMPAAEDFVSSPAVGVSARVGGQTIRVGGPRLLEETGLRALPITADWTGSTVLHVLAEDTVIGAVGLADEARPESSEAIRALHAAGIRTVMITGDARGVADTVATELGIDTVLAQVRPEDKSAEVAGLQAAGQRVAMVGDGVNDAPALAAADVGIAVGAGTDVAMGSAGVVLARSDPRGVLSVLRLSRASYRKMAQNLWWAAGYNLFAVPLAAGVLAPIGFTLPMWAGAILMSASTVVVALNAQLLRKVDLDPATVSAELTAEAGQPR